MFYNDIRPIAQALNHKQISRYKQDQIKREIHLVVQEEIAKIAIRTNNSPYIEDHVEYTKQIYEDANEGNWHNPPAEPVDTEVAMNDAVLKQLNII